MDSEQRRIIEFSWEAIHRGAGSLRADPARRTTWTVAVFDPWDTFARSFYRHLARGSLRAEVQEPIEKGTVRVIGVPWRETLAVASQLYEVAPLVEKELGPDEVRLLVATKGTLSLHVVEGDGFRAEGQVFKATIGPPPSKRPGADALIVGTTCFHSDRGGFALYDVMKTKDKGAELLRQIRYVVERLDAESETPERVEQKLWEWARSPRPLTPRHRGLVFGGVYWLEERGYLETDDHNGVELHFGPASALKNADELIASYVADGATAVLVGGKKKLTH